jgi:hypothetical protein
MAFNEAKSLQKAEGFANQGKISQAIKQYFDIFERDPSDVILLNTIGDLYIRLRGDRASGRSHASLLGDRATCVWPGRHGGCPDCFEEGTGIRSGQPPDTIAQGSRSLGAQAPGGSRGDPERCSGMEG